MRTARPFHVLAPIALALVCCTVPRIGFSDPVKVASNHLPNCYRVTDKVLSGGEPDGPAAFEELRALGIKTIISVDGARPDVALARKYGLRYVHLPHGYDGIPPERVRELAKAVRDLPGPIYVHCHHGKHRSPAAAAVACIAAGSLSSNEAQVLLKAAGTSPNYRGLFRSVESTARIDPAELDNTVVVFREAIEVPPLAKAMVAVDHTFDHLKTLAAAGWKATPKHPDLVPAHEALLLKEHFAELLRSDDVGSQARGFLESMREAKEEVERLETALRDSKTEPKQLDTAFERVTRNCQSCHERFRDVPLGEKAKP